MKHTTETALKADLFRELPRDCVVSLIEKGSVKTIGRGASIHLQGEPAHSLYVILDGWVKLYRISPCGSEVVISVLNRAKTFGEAAAVSGERFPTSAEAVTETNLLQIDAQDLCHAVEGSAVMCRAVLSAALHRNHALVKHLAQIKSHTGAQRIAHFLLGLCPSDTEACTVVLPYDKVLIAGWLGLKPESLSRAFRKLTPHGVKIVKDRAVIESVERLLDFAEEDPTTSWSPKYA